MLEGALSASRPPDGAPLVEIYDFINDAGEARQ
jgi:hypothetical protein